MNIKSSRAYIFLILIGLLILAYTLHDARKNGPAYNVNAVLEKEINEWIQTAKWADRKPLATVAGIQWDWVCRSGLMGDGLDVARRALREHGIDFSEFSISDHSFFDEEYGLTFISVQNNLLVTTPLLISAPYHINAPVNAQQNPIDCVPAAAFSLTGINKGKLNTISIVPNP